ncbi:Formamidopyrimidine-DNA glycosylase [Streptococcus sp. DD10]|uniref:DNA-formamidopyrimidine glycosylase n=1 Tax=Streptococcus sp. DD10 TaxID=1777878 RepID=UPI000797C275|nr:DNA-formamidopyrimidine glycosylase [Streptococcus sp. DD10]KXT73488.1 Formamidopyrimidine-DNA glycosylase [Streptococcus sp. DD10]
MPELPEVETVRRGLEALILGKKIESVKIGYPKMIKTDLKAFQEKAPGQVVEKMGRRGKYLLFYLTDQVLISHLRMEGKYFYYPDQVPERKHAHVFIRFEEGGTLVYEDVRKFGTMELLAPELVDSYFLSKKLGPEPKEDEFDLQVFQATLAKSKKLFKSHLLDQTLVAGLGNIYVDEVLWRAKIHPSRISSSITNQEVVVLHQYIIEVLQEAIEKGGSTIRSYSNAFGENGTMQHAHKVYGKTGQPCSRCGVIIEKIQLGGRGSHFCPNCQRGDV